MILHANEEPPISRLKAEVEGPEKSSGRTAKARDVEAAGIERSLPVQDVFDHNEEGTTVGGLEETPSIKSDSEAETIIILGRVGDTTLKEHKVIESEDCQVDEGPIRTAESNVRKREGISNANANQHLALSSGLRSPRSSPEAGVQLAREGLSNSGQVPPLSDVIRLSVENNKPRTRKRKLDDEYGGSDGEGDTRGVGQQHAVESKHRYAEEQEEINHNNNRNTRPSSRERSPSPRSKSRRRSARSKSNEALANGVSVKRRKLPPLITTRESKKSDEQPFGPRSHSNSPDPFEDLGGAASREGSIMSPVKTAPLQSKRDKIGRTPLAKACSERKMEIVRRALVEWPGDLNVADNAGNTPLQIASLEGYAEIVKVLIEHRADVECQNNERDTPLIDAVENGHLEVVQLLLEAGANPRQGNLNGAEPLELIDPDKDNPEAIKSALTSACKKWVRRQSEDHNHQLGPTTAATFTRDGGRSSRGASTISPRQSPPVNNPRSPPVPGTAPRRKTGRSEATRNDLLWIKPTLENLREFAGKGDLVGVLHILNINPRADAESLIAAARGGHDEVIQLLLGLGGVDADSRPVRTHKAGFNTPMLAAIGRGNEKVIQLFLDQPKFDPTRKDHRGYTYHEISKERQGINWEKEYDILKQAYDKATEGRQGKSGWSPRGGIDSSVGKRDAASAQGRQDETESSSPEGPNLKKQVQGSTQRLVRAGSSRSDSIKRESEPDVSEGLLSTKERSSQKPAISRKNSSNVGSLKERSTASSDRDPRTLGRPKEEGHKTKRRQSDVYPGSDDEGKAKRYRSVIERLSKDTTEKKRRESNASAALALSKVERFEAEHEHAISVNSRRNSITSIGRHEDGSRTDTTRRLRSEHHIAKLDVEEKLSKNKPSANSAHEAGSKRQRNSASPRGSEIQAAQSSNGQADDFKQKRRKLEPQPPSANRDIDRATTEVGARTGNSHVQVASMTRSPEEIAASGGYTHLPFEGQSNSGGQPEFEHGSFAFAQDRKETRGSNAPRAPRQPQMVMQIPNRLAPVANMEVERPKVVTARHSIGFLREQDALAKRTAQEEQEKLLREQKEKAETIRKAQQKALEWAKRIEEEHQKKILAEQEEAERKMREKERVDEERRRAEEAERQERQQREQRAEQERLRREEMEKRRVELEERQRLEFLRRQEQQERSRRNALPYALQRLADLPSHLSQTYDEVQRCMPLYTVELKELDPECVAEEANELWMINFQAAAVLGVSDLALSQYTAWTKRSITERHKVHLWRATRLMLQGNNTKMHVSVEDQAMRDMITQAKFRALETVFWIKYSDFVDITPRYPHLRGIELRTSMLHGLDQEAHPVSRNNISRDPLGWTVTPFENGYFTSFTKGEMVIDQIPTYTTLFPAVNEQLPMRLRHGGNIPNGLSNH